MKRFLISMGLLSLAAAGATAQQPASADLVIRHGRVWTVDRAHPQAEKDAAVRYTVVGGKVVYEAGKN
jgi:hypothetical protein